MSLTQVFDQLCEDAPLPVMARAALEHALRDDLLDQLFAEHAKRQVSGELLFSAVVKLMTLVACRIRPSVNAAYQKQPEAIGVSLQALYAKLRGIEPQVTRALVRETAARLSAVADELDADLEAPFPGYQNRVLDGAHLAATEHRLKELRTIAAGPLPGLGLCVLDPARQLILDFIPCEDAYTQERRLLETVIDDLQPGQVWIADRNFCTATFVWELHANGAFFVIREHAQNVRWTPLGEETACGRTETGEVFEQAIEIHDDFGNRFPARRVRVALDKPTRDGDCEMTILTNLPAQVSAVQVAEGYRRRWTIETAFAVVQKCLEGEIRALGYPQAALFSYGMALFSFNILQVLRAAMRAAHGRETIEQTFSTHHMAEDISMVWRGLTLIFTAAFWRRRYGGQDACETAQELLRLAKLVRLSHYKKVTRTSRKPPPKRTSSKKTPHVSTARLLEQRE
jgi:IS4 transposase